jgi:DNA polymerase
VDARRLSYLRALDIDVWVHKDAAPAAPDVQQPLDERSQASNTERVFETRVAQSAGANAESMTWDALEQAVRTCERCSLHKTRTNTVFGVGNRNSEWMVIGEAPGADEDRQGEPFVGRAGQLLNSMLKALGHPREQVFIANILKCRPPGNRDPQPQEAECCTPYLSRQIELINPRIILCVGRIAAQTLLETDTPIGKLRGKVHTWGVRKRPVVVTYHPAYLLRSPGEKRKAWQDLLLALQTHAQLAREGSDA